MRAPAGLHHHACTHAPAPAGLMTIGMPDYTSRPENFVCLNDCRAAVAADLGLPVESLELSMGMSGDFEQAVGVGLLEEHGPRARRGCLYDA
jgi:uncharacterized pyridoxal phosphate-containing UPF0001 family protein